MTETSQTKTENTSLPTIAIDPTKLPSGGRAYPKGITMKYRPYMWGEVKKMSTSMGMTVSEILKMIVDGVECDGMNPYDLTFADVSYIAILRHLSAVGQSQLEIPYIHPFTNKTEKYVFDVGDIEFVDLAPKVKFPIKVKFSTCEMHFSLFTLNNLLAMSRKFKAEDITKNPTAVMALCVRNMDYQAAYNLISKFGNNGDGELLDEVSTLIDHKMKPIKIVCTDGDHKKTISVGLDGRQSLITPFRAREDNIGSRISFGDESHS